ncbi:hypothetical protein FNV43_RR16568 [Rhamnella rubrinervis]|uniref:Phorbol-ester/DAG-type domain-containing protein n=1 Tax=Rhamnella rubrinervis TaxID=2594499 RepID=A0A8K0GZ05_9ROSA|nr:hypothetical protein FNV43_RR16568 [Rhamnella rubrinervis]
MPIAMRKANCSLEQLSHPMHNLTILPYPHLLLPSCAMLVTLHHQTHAHQLSLTYAIPHHTLSAHLCNICHKYLDCKLWTYNCFGCNFRGTLPVQTWRSSQKSKKKIVSAQLGLHNLRRKRMFSSFLPIPLPLRPAQASTNDEDRNYRLLSLSATDSISCDSPVHCSFPSLFPFIFRASNSPLKQHTLPTKNILSPFLKPHHPLWTGRKSCAIIVGVLALASLTTFVLPAIISTKHHEHQFTLTQTNSIEGNSDEAYCDFCEEEANLEGSLYYCESCNYSAHLGCVISAPTPHVKFSYKDAEYSSTETLDRQEVESSETNLNFGIQFGQSDDDALNESSTDDSKLLQAGRRHNEVSFEGYDIGELPSNLSRVKQLGNVVKLEHFSHQHPLILNDEHKGEVNCYGCLRSISSLAYSCNQCNYFLHEWCAMLPCDIVHPLHPYHTLTLLERAPDFFGCGACKISCDNFIYNCQFCAFSLQLECASIPSTIKSEVHQHLLTLRPRRENSTGCMACSEDHVVAAFQCDECSTEVDFPCALLPHKVRHKCHVHPFTLKYSHVDDSDEFYCDFCEKRRDPKLWIYYCEECDYIAHTKCLTAELFEYVQSSGLVQHDHHRHILNLIMNSPTAP